MAHFLTGLLLGIAISTLAYRVGALSRSGAIAAAVCGGIIFGLGGLSWAILLMTFFISSSALSRAFSRRKAGLSEKFSKGSRRDWGQVAANGGLGALIVLLHARMPEQGWLWIAYAGAIAAVNADTWATELGVLNPNPPRLVTSGKIVERGTSGGISLLGSLAALGGAGLVATCALFFTPQSMLDRIAAPALLAAVALGGVAGSFFDSVLGATIQAIYFCPACQKETERHPRHLCGTETRQTRGWRWMDNDMVNFLASLAGALATMGIWWLVG
jgi:uncharacterized protein (TIGR00297 family)